MKSSMKKITLILVSLVLTSNVISAGEQSKNSGSNTTTQAEQSANSRSELKYNGVKPVGRWNAIYCKYLGKFGKSVLVLKESFEENSCPATIPNER